MAHQPPTVSCKYYLSFQLLYIIQMKNYLCTEYKIKQLKRFSVKYTYKNTTKKTMFVNKLKYKLIHAL